MKFLQSNIGVLALGVLLLVAGTVYLVSNRIAFLPLMSDRPFVSVDGFMFEIADTPQAQQQGLSGRTNLPDTYGMLFIFDEPSRPGIWMKDMLTSIDIVWLSDTGVVVGIEHNVSPDTYQKVPPDVFYPPSPISYALEVRAGVASARGWVPGSVIALPKHK
jgi:uncharacterized membrane protein (UPF0127 family)